jgi:hypothetical protein
MSWGSEAEFSRIQKIQFRGFRGMDEYGLKRKNFLARYGLQRFYLQRFYSDLNGLALRLWRLWRTKGLARCWCGGHMLSNKKLLRVGAMTAQVELISGGRVELRPIRVMVLFMIAK